MNRKKVMVLLLCTCMLLFLASCNKNNIQSSDSKSSAVFGLSEDESSKGNEISLIDHADFAEIEDAISECVETASEHLQSELNQVYESVGNSYEGYIKNLQKIEDWYALSRTESEKLYSDIVENCIIYYKMIANSTDLTDYNSWNRIMDDCYDIWDDAMDDYYDTWDDLYDDIYDKCDNLVTSAYDEVDYKEASEAWSNMYSKYSDSWSAMYSTYSDAWSLLYSNHSAIWSGFYNEKSDVDALLQEAETERAQNDHTEVSDSQNSEEIDTSENNSNGTSPTNNGIRSEFKEAMDSYEAFFDEYAEFMQNFTESGNTLGMLTDYGKFMEQYTETMEALEELGEQDMSSEELKYYTEVMTRINQKLIDSVT